MVQRVGVFPGSFNPLTTAHLAIVQAARRQRRLDVVVLAFSRSPINKEHVDRPRFEHRVAVARTEAVAHEGLDVAVTDHRLLVDIARGFDVLIMGADKWLQVIDPQYYGGSSEARDAAVAALPELAIAPRPPLEVPAEHALRIEGEHAEVSSTLARAGHIAIMCDAARAFDEATGAWTDPARYDTYLRTGDY